MTSGLVIISNRWRAHWRRRGPQATQVLQQRPGDALLAEVLQDQRGKLADHSSVHAQCLERIVQVITVLHVVAQRVAQRRLTFAVLA